ncbi:MAG: hypothetical protein SNJ82_07135 [Gemmataceae bacterium]
MFFYLAMKHGLLVLWLTLRDLVALQLQRTTGGLTRRVGRGGA